MTALLLACFFGALTLAAIGASNGNQALALVGGVLIVVWAAGLGLANRYGR